MWRWRWEVVWDDRKGMIKRKYMETRDVSCLRATRSSFRMWWVGHVNSCGINPRQIKIPWVCFLKTKRKGNCYVFLQLKIKDLCLIWEENLCSIQRVKTQKDQQQNCCQNLCSSVRPGQGTCWSQQRWVEPRAGTLQLPLLSMKMSQQLHHTHLPSAAELGRYFCLLFAWCSHIISPYSLLANQDQALNLGKFSAVKSV